MHSVIADSVGGAWSFGGPILTSAFPMILLTVVACAQYVAYTKPEVVPGHPRPAGEHPVTYTAVAGKPAADDGGKAPGGLGEAFPRGKQEPEGGE